MTEEVIPLDKLARVYRKIRDRVQLLTKEYETQVEELKAQQNEIKIAMKDQMRAIGSSSIRTSEGTIVLVQKVRYYTGQVYSSVTPIMKANGLRNPSLRFLWVEENDNRGDNINSWAFDRGNLAWVDAPAVYHGVSSTFSFCDGHSESHKWQNSETRVMAKNGTQHMTPVAPNIQDITYVKEGYPCQENP